MQRILIKKYLLLTVGPSDFHLLDPLKSHPGGRYFADYEEVETEVRKWPRQQSKHLNAERLDALVELWDKCINIGGGYVEK
jgi:hypothetical protein